MEKPAPSFNLRADVLESEKQFPINRLRHSLGQAGFHGSTSPGHDLASVNG